MRDLLLLTVHLLLIVGCSGDDDSAPPTVQESLAFYPDEYVIDSAALVGCRAPDESGCLQCCRPRSNGNCTVFDGDIDWSLYPGVDPWYSTIGFRDGACAADCAPCATCSERAEKVLTDFAENPLGCDCATQTIGIDPCFGGGCACYCHSLLGALESCPVSPDLLE